MTSQRERNDRRGGARSDPKGRRPPARRRVGPAESAGWIWGLHPVEAALRNPDRPPPDRVLVSPDRLEALRRLRPEATFETLPPAEIALRLPGGAVHQGAALQTPPLEGVDLDSLAEPAEGLLVMLDQVTDPQNVGSIFRSAAAFGARGVILQDRHAPPLGGALAKAAAGAIDQVPAARVVNLSRALERLSDAGWAVVGLDGRGETVLEAALDRRPTVLVLGSEGEGLRRLVAEHCDLTARIPMPGGFESLNVAMAAAVALYAASRARAGGEPA